MEIMKVLLSIFITALFTGCTSNIYFIHQFAFEYEVIENTKLDTMVVQKLPEIIKSNMRHCISPVIETEASIMKQDRKITIYLVNTCNDSVFLPLPIAIEDFNILIQSKNTHRNYYAGIEWKTKASILTSKRKKNYLPPGKAVRCFAPSLSKIVNPSGKASIFVPDSYVIFVQYLHSTLKNENVKQDAMRVLNQPPEARSNSAGFQIE